MGERARGRESERVRGWRSDGVRVVGRHGSAPPQPMTVAVLPAAVSWLVMAGLSRAAS